MLGPHTDCKQPDSNLTDPAVHATPIHASVQGIDPLRYWLQPLLTSQPLPFVASNSCTSATLSLPLLLDPILGHPTLPPSHSRHTAAPSPLLNLPTPQLTQAPASIARTSLLKRPATQLVQLMAPALEYRPAGHTDVNSEPGGEWYPAVAPPHSATLMERTLTYAYAGREVSAGVTDG
jgi:hypothetical protein